MAAVCDAFEAFEKSAPFQNTPAQQAINDVVQTLARDERRPISVVVTGAPGVGKTTFVKTLLGLDPASNDFHSYPVKSGHGVGFPTTAVTSRFIRGYHFQVMTIDHNGTRRDKGFFENKEEFAEGVEAALKNSKNLSAIELYGPWRIPSNAVLVDCPPIGSNDPLFDRRIQAATKDASVIVVVGQRIPGSNILATVLSSPDVRNVVPVCATYMDRTQMTIDSVMGTPVIEWTLEVATGTMLNAEPLPPKVRAVFAKKMMVCSFDELESFWDEVEAAHKLSLKERLSNAASLCKLLATHPVTNLPNPQLRMAAFKAATQISIKLADSIDVEDFSDNLEKVKLAMAKDVLLPVAELKQQIADAIFEVLPDGLNFAPQFFDPATTTVNISAPVCAELEKLSLGLDGLDLEIPAKSAFFHSIDPLIQRLACEVQTSILEVLSEFCSEDRIEADFMWKVKPEAEVVADLLAVLDPLIMDQEELKSNSKKRRRL